jgi:hypothetical protein
MNEAAVITLGVIAFCELGVILFLVWLLHNDNAQIIAMTDRMARRVQAPQLAAAETANEEHSPLYAPPALIPDDDDAYWESREALADRAMKEEVSGGDR